MLDYSSLGSLIFYCFRGVDVLLERWSTFVLQSTDVIYQKKRFYDFGFGNQTSYYDVAANVLFVDDDDFDTALVDDGEASWPRQQAASQASWVDADVAPHRQERGYVGHFSKSKTKRNSNYNAPSLAAAMKRDVMGGKAGGGISERAGAKKSSGHVLYDEGTAVYDEVFSEDVFLGRATRVGGLSFFVHRSSSV